MAAECKKCKHAEISDDVVGKTGVQDCDIKCTHDHGYDLAPECGDICPWFEAVTDPCSLLFTNELTNQA